MQPDDANELHSLLSSYPNVYQPYVSFTQNNARESIGPLYNLQMNPQQGSFSNNSTSDEADERQFSTIINERKQRRMISNRESARRSRMRKQRHLDELCSQVIWLRNENHYLLDKFNNLSESHDKVVQENDQLKQETSGLRQVIADLELSSPFSSLKDLDDINFDVNQSDTSP